MKFKRYVHIICSQKKKTLHTNTRRMYKYNGTTTMQCRLKMSLAIFFINQKNIHILQKFENISAFFSSSFDMNAFSLVRWESLTGFYCHKWQTLMWKVMQCRLASDSAWKALSYSIFSLKQKLYRIQCKLSHWFVCWI